MVSAVDWKKLQIKLPKNFEKLTQLCLEYERQVQHINHITPLISGLDIQELMSKTVRIISEYLRLIQQEGEVEERTLGMLKIDIYQTLSQFYDEKTGKMKNITSDIISTKRAGTEKDFVPLFISPISAFIQSKIYDSLTYALEEGQQKITSEFVINTCRKAGVLVSPQHKTSTSNTDDDGLSALLPPRTKSASKAKDKAAMADIDLTKEGGIP